MSPHPLTGSCSSLLFNLIIWGHVWLLLSHCMTVQVKHRQRSNGWVCAACICMCVFRSSFSWGTSERASQWMRFYPQCFCLCPCLFGCIVFVWCIHILCWGHVCAILPSVLWLPSEQIKAGCVNNTFWWKHQCRYIQNPPCTKSHKSDARTHTVFLILIMVMISYSWDLSGQWPWQNLYCNKFQRR